MCGRYALNAPPELIAELFALSEVPELEPHYNIAPTQRQPIVRVVAGARRLDSLRWGLVPPWADDLTIGARMINARAETAAQKPAFRDAFRRHRCLVPASGFFEWKAEAGVKQPYYIHPREGLFALAGLWDRWRAPDSTIVETYTILTTEANELLRSLHDRMPVILRPDVFAQWLDPGFHEVGALADLMRPAPPEGIQLRSVSRRVNNVANDDAECVAPA